MSAYYYYYCLKFHCIRSLYSNFCPRPSSLNFTNLAYFVLATNVILLLMKLILEITVIIIFLNPLSSFICTCGIQVRVKILLCPLFVKLYFEFKTNYTFMDVSTKDNSSLCTVGINLVTPTWAASRSASSKLYKMPFLYFNQHEDLQMLWWWMMMEHIFVLT